MTRGDNKAAFAARLSELGWKTGSLLSYAPDLAAAWKRLVDLADKALGLKIAQSLLLQATRVIE